MRQKLRICYLSLLAIIAVMISQPIYAEKISLGLKSPYVETMKKGGLTKDVVKDYKMVSSYTKDQSSKLQSAINDISKKGGGKLIIPEGIYCFSEVYMASNVHILVNEKAVLRPAGLLRETKGKGGIPNYSYGIMLHFSHINGRTSPKFIENCSIRSENGGRFTVDYSHLPLGDAHQVRFICARMVRNFLIADVNIQDNYTKFCGIIFVPVDIDNVSKLEVSRPTNGEIRDCSIFNANSGYGLCQFHGAQSLYLENIYAKGGITLRLEPDIVSEVDGIGDIRAVNVRSENGRAAVMMNPHTVHCGTIKVDGVWAKSSSFGVLIHKGFIDDQNKNNPNATIGTYADDSEVVNIHVIYGIDAQVDRKEIWILEPNDAKYALYRDNLYLSKASFDGPSVAPVFDNTRGMYKVTCRNITSEGFDSHETYPLMYDEVKDRERNRWPIVDAMPITKELKAKGTYK